MGRGATRQSAPRPVALQAAAETSASSLPGLPWGVEAPWEMGGESPLKLVVRGAL